jgi:3-oxoacyl-[acyl-carrier protein] reductase
MHKQVFVISGTSRGIGKHLAQYYSDIGNIVYGFSRSDSGFKHENYHHHIVDIANDNEISEFVRLVKREAHRIDVLICNAAIAPANIPGIATNSSILTQCVDINFKGSFNLLREISKVMLQKKYGRVICFSTMAAGLHDSGAALYASTKAAITETAKIFAKEMAQYNITYNVVAPSVVKTGMSDALGDEIIKNAIQRLVIKRPLEMDEITYACDFFIQPEAGHITGQTIYLGLVC